MAAIETKVIAATAGGGAGAAISAFVLWLLGITVWNVPNSAASAGDAIAAVPTPVAGIIGIGVTAGITLAAGYLAPHTPKPPAVPTRQYGPVGAYTPPPAVGQVEIPVNSPPDLP